VTSRQVPAPPDGQVLGRVLLPLRVFLGFTFCFAGLQKLANPRFFDAADPASIQAQLAGAARRSPVHALISPLAHIAVPLGIIIALGELAVGTGTLLGFRAKAAAAGGLALALMLFLTVSFHSSPYYTGADIVFAFAWTPLLLAGSGPVLSLDAALAGRAARWAGGTASSHQAGTAAPGRSPPGQAIGPASGVPVGQAASFTDPSSGDPSLVIQPSAGTFVAFDAVCPHVGCPVDYDAAQKVIACPCHGSQFNASTGAVEVGPATTGLKKLAVAEGSNGQLYVT
jgi:thiosulfate dehydrogenase (quinone) large subunit